jgi:Xaa-Pro dipeptidase
MLTANQSRERRARLIAGFDSPRPIVLADPIHLSYFADAYVDPISISADFGAFLVIQPDGGTKLIHDHRAPKSLESAWVDERVALPWYAGETPGQGPRRLVLREALKEYGGRIHDSLADPDSQRLHELVAGMRRAKDADEIAMIRHCCEIARAGFEWAAANLRAGMTELDVYNGVFSACTTKAGNANVVYGDFAVSLGMNRKGGPPTRQVLGNGDLFILDYSVIIRGYRSDYTNTFCIGGQPTAKQLEMYDLCHRAMAAGESQLKAGASCQTVYDSVMAVFDSAGLAANFPHHAGHGLGLTHPEAPFFVRKSTETLVAGDVVTLEPGLYLDGHGGMRIEHNYAITPTGFEKLSSHVISPTGMGRS